MLNVPNFPSRQTEGKSSVNKCTMKCLKKVIFVFLTGSNLLVTFQLKKKKKRGFFHAQQGKVLFSLHSAFFQIVHLQNIASLVLLFTPAGSDSPHMLCGALYRTALSNPVGGASWGNHFTFY